MDRLHPEVRVGKLLVAIEAVLLRKPGSLSLNFDAARHDEGGQREQREREEVADPDV
jgi:hypothetical protein